MLNLFPLPNTVDPTGQRQYNFTDVLSNTDPRRDILLRGDYNISAKDTMFVRGLKDYQAQSGFGAILGAAGDGWGQFPHSYFIPSVGIAATYVHMFSSNLINEVTAGQNRAHQQNHPTNQAAYNASLLPLKVNWHDIHVAHDFRQLREHPEPAAERQLRPAIGLHRPVGSPRAFPNLPELRLRQPVAV